MYLNFKKFAVNGVESPRKFELGAQLALEGNPEEESWSSNLLQLTENCVKNLSSIFQQSIFEKNESYLKRKVQLLSESISTSPEYLKDLMTVKEQLLQQEIDLENEVLKGRELTNDQSQMAKRNKDMQQSVGNVEQQVIQKMFKLKHDISTSHLRSLFNTRNARILKNIVQSCQQEIRAISFMQNPPTVLVVTNGSLSNTTQKVLPQYEQIRQEGPNFFIEYTFKNERDLALEILRLVTGLDYSEQKGNFEKILSFITRKREEKHYFKTIDDPLLMQIRKVLAQIEDEDFVVKSGKQSLVRKNKFNKSIMEQEVETENKENKNKQQGGAQQSAESLLGKKKRKTWDRKP